MILLDINSSDDRPIYSQIADQVKFAVAGGVCARVIWFPRCASYRNN